MTRKKPVAVHVLEGTFRPDRHKGGIQPREHVPRCPDWLGPVGKRTWKQTVAALKDVPGLLTKLDADMLALYCEAWEDFHDARSQIAKEGATCVSEKGGTYQHPAVGRKNKALERIRILGAKYGMSPTDWGSVTTDTLAKSRASQEENDLVARFLR